MAEAIAALLMSNLNFTVISPENSLFAGRGMDLFSQQNQRSPSVIPLSNPGLHYLAAAIKSQRRPQPARPMRFCPARRTRRPFMHRPTALQLFSSH
jgi:hypothetical protein